MNAQRDISKYLIESFKTVADLAITNHNPIIIPNPANSTKVQESEDTIFRTTGK